MNLLDASTHGLLAPFSFQSIGWILEFYQQPAVMAAAAQRTQQRFGMMMRDPHLPTVSLAYIQARRSPIAPASRNDPPIV
jgi:hypothetical protein